MNLLLLPTMQLELDQRINCLELLASAEVARAKGVCRHTSVLHGCFSSHKHLYAIFWTHVVKLPKACEQTWRILLVGLICSLEMGSKNCEASYPNGSTIFLSKQGEP